MRRGGGLTGESRLTVEDATDRTLWEQLAEYLFDGYKKAEGTKGAGNHLSIQTAQDYLKTALQLAQAVHVGHPFFECLNPLVDKRVNDDRKWFLNLRSTVSRSVRRQDSWIRILKHAAWSGDILFRVSCG